MFTGSGPKSSSKEDDEEPSYLVEHEQWLGSAPTIGDVQEEVERVEGVRELLKRGKNDDQQKQVKPWKQ